MGLAEFVFGFIYFSMTFGGVWGIEVAPLEIQDRLIWDRDIWYEVRVYENGQRTEVDNEQI